MIKCCDLNLFIQGNHILKDINWTIGPGDQWVLYGRNGSGKSKLLQCITGYEFPSTGTIERFGLPHQGTDIRELRKHIGYLSTSLKDRFHPREQAGNVILSGLFSTIGLYDQVSPQDRDRAQYLLKEIGLGRRYNDYITTFSDGEKQKILLARALINEPHLIIMDEPASSLDAGYREEFLAGLANLMQQKDAAVIYVTHHTEEIIPLFTHILMLNHGSVFYQGPVEQGLTSENLSRLYNQTMKVMQENHRYYTRLYSE